VSNVAVKFTDFGFKYKAQQEPTLYDINLEIKTGEKVLILGGSGSGKSTLANCINGLIPFSYEGTCTGSVTVNGCSTLESSIFELSKVVGTVLQDSDAQFVGLSVGEDIAFAMENAMVPRSEMVPVVEERASIVGMQDFIRAIPFELSGGQKQKVAIAGVYGNEVNILIFDEPLASLDPKMGQTAIELIDNLCNKAGCTVIIIEHRLEDVLHRPVDRVILMAEGRIVADTTPDELLRSSLLAQHGIREPLYITAMKYAGCSLATTQNLCDIETIQFSPTDTAKLKTFFQTETTPIEFDLGEPLVELSNVFYAYDRDYVLEDISFSVRKGERVAVVGKNGAGKSTTARLICGVGRPNKGDLAVCGKDAKKLSIKEIGEHVAFVMQNPNEMLIKDIIKKEVELALEIRNTGAQEIIAKATAALTACRLYPMRNWPVDMVSYGQKKRITIASMLVLEPQVLILDEPTAGQDYRSYTDIMRFVEELNRDYGITIIFITHDMHLALEHTDRAIVFADGKLVADERVFSVLSNDDVIARANLKQTSLYTLAKKIGLEPETVIRHFIEHERAVRSRE
jgi:energy-coupling factor transport system ATP-binding protein